jgi:hypothetical protein
MSDVRPQRSRRQGFGGFLPDDSLAPLTPIPPRREHPPKVWGEMLVEGDEVVVRLSGWRAVYAVRRELRIPASAVTRVEHDPAVRSHVSAKLRRRGGRSGVFRIGSYHSLAGWSFWSVGLARNAVLIESEATRYRFVVVEVADPARTVSEIGAAAGLHQPGRSGTPPVVGGTPPVGPDGA